MSYNYPIELNDDKRLVLGIIRNEVDKEILSIFGFRGKRVRIQKLQRRFEMIDDILKKGNYGPVQRAYINVWKSEYIDVIVHGLKVKNGIK